MRTFGTLLKNELKLNIRNMNMVIFAIIMPLLVLVILGFLYGTNPAAGTAYTFLDQSFGALCTISICAGGLMGLPLVVAEYRERKILKRFQVTPVSPVMLLAVEFTIYVIYAAFSMLTLLPVAKLFWNVTIHGSWLAFMGGWLLTLVSTLSIGMMVGGIAKNEKSASARSHAGNDAEIHPRTPHDPRHSTHERNFPWSAGRQRLASHYRDGSCDHSLYRNCGKML